MIRRTSVHLFLVLLTAGVLASACGTDATNGSPRTTTTAPSAQASAVAPSPSGPPSPTAPPASFALPQGDDPLELDPASFAGVAIDHPFWPMAVGSRWVYRETDAEGAEQDVQVTVTEDTRVILGITATVVHDIVTADDEVIEDTYDWYAQDNLGHLWYLGEDTKEFEHGEVVSTEGSWEAGVDGALAGIILPADPQVGMTYRQEYYAGQAEDAAEVVSVLERVEVPAGTWDECLETRDFTPLDPDLEEHKYYAWGVGPVQVIQTSGGSSREELVTFEPGG